MAPQLRLFRLPPRFQRRARKSRMRLLTSLCLVFMIIIATPYVIYKPPHLLIQYFAHRWPDVLWEVPLPSNRKVIALSIDDAPSRHTSEIAAVLKANDAHATFFVIGHQVPGHVEVLSELVKDGHELGNHAMYDQPARSLSQPELQKQVKSVEQSIGDAYSVIGKTRPATKWFRPGSGFFSQRILDTIKEQGLKMALGSVYPHDAQLSYPWLNARHILSGVRPGSLIICHDRRSWTLPMLERVLPELKRRGYEVVTISQLVAEGQRVEEMGGEESGDVAGEVEGKGGQQGPASQGKKEKQEMADTGKEN